MTETNASINLIKLCVGVQEIAQLEATTKRARDAGQFKWISTRNMPKRKDELVAGGSLYWVISGLIQVRQNILEMEMGPTEMGTRAIIKLEPKLILTEHHPKRPFQGWRYLTPADAPADLSANSRAMHLPPSLESDIKAALAW